jgi:hypothetical protein
MSIQKLEQKHTIHISLVMLSLLTAATDERICSARTCSVVPCPAAVTTPALLLLPTPPLLLLFLLLLSLLLLLLLLPLALLQPPGLEPMLLVPACTCTDHVGQRQMLAFPIPVVKRKPCRQRQMLCTKHPQLSPTTYCTGQGKQWATCQLAIYAITVCWALNASAIQGYCPLMKYISDQLCTEHADGFGQLPCHRTCSS